MPATTRVRALVESALLVGLATVLGIINYAVPFLSLLLFFVPGLLGFVVLRHGWTWGVLALVVQWALTSLLVGIPFGLWVTGSFGLPGIVLGYGFRMRWNPVLRLGVTSLFFALSVAAHAYVTHLLMPGYFWTQIQEGMQQSVALLGAQEQAVAQMEATFQNMLYRVIAIAVGGILLMTYLCNAIMELLCRRRHIPYRPFPLLIFWEFPRWILIVYGLAIYAIYRGGDASHWMYLVGLNVLTICQLLVSVQGLAYLRYLCFMYNVSFRVFVGIAVLFLFVPFLTTLLTGGGAMECLFRWRRRNGLFEQQAWVETQLRR